MLKVKIEKLVFGGQGLGRAGGKVVLAWNALPGEEVLVRVEDERSSYVEGVAEKVLVASPSRIEAAEGHYPSCSPWQILDYPAENEWKKKISREVFSRVPGVPEDLEVAFDDRQFHYRNKIEYRFARDGRGRTCLAFFARGTNDVVPIEHCDLASEPINVTAGRILDWLVEARVPVELLRSMVLRSNLDGETAAEIFLKGDFPFVSYPVLDGKFVGFRISRVTPRPPGPSITETVSSWGKGHLVETVKGVRLKYGITSFFQVNVPMFERALTDIGPHLEVNRYLLDYYAGVGAVSLPLSTKCRSCVLVENNEESVAFAKENIASNGIRNGSVSLKPAEQMTDLIRADGIVLFDPPRAGLHRNIISKLLDVRPFRIIYLSCNVSSQARDLGKLSEQYGISCMKLYNFFPRTPHVESLVVLDRRP